MPSPIDMMLDRMDWKCAVCGTSQKVGCGCWVQLRCPTCKRAKTVQRDKTDPPNTARVEVQCNDCNHGDFAEVNYFNSAGQQIDCDAGQPLT